MAQDQEFTETLTGETAPVVYVRSVAASEVFDAAAESGIEVGGVTLEPDATLYTVHDEQGRRVGVFTDRNHAFAAARYHGADPVSVH